jgi:hypothetical protein
MVKKLSENKTRKVIRTKPQKGHIRVYTKKPKRKSIFDL